MEYGEFGRLYQLELKCEKCGQPTGDHIYRKGAEPKCPKPKPVIPAVGQGSG